MLRLGAIPAAAFLLSMVRAPESPRFLIQAGKTEEGFAVLEHIIGTEQARLRTDDIHASVKLETEMSHEFHDLFRPGLQKALIIGTLIKARMLRCVTALPCCHVAALLHRYVVTLPRYCIATLPRCHITLHCRIAALPHHISQHKRSNAMTTGDGIAATREEPQCNAVT